MKPIMLWSVDSKVRICRMNHKSFLIGNALAFAGLMMFLAIAGWNIAIYQDKLRQEAETLRQARAGALAAAGLSRSHANDGNARIGALIALSVTPDSRRSDDPRYVYEIEAALANALTRPIEIRRHYHQRHVLSVAFSPDGRRIVSGSGNNTVRLWDADSGQAIGQPMTGHDAVVLSVAFSPDGRRIVSGSGDNTVRLWDVRLFIASLQELADRAEKLCPLSEVERRQLHLDDPQARATAKPLTPQQRLACGGEEGSR